MTSNRDDVVLNALCPSCGEVELSTDQLWLVIVDAPGSTHYRFWCSGCTTLVSCHADAAATDLLTRLVAVEQLHVPDEALEDHDGPSLTPDDLLDLVLALEQHSPSARMT